MLHLCLRLRFKPIQSSKKSEIYDSSCECVIRSILNANNSVVYGKFDVLRKFIVCLIVRPYIWTVHSGNQQLQITCNNTLDQKTFKIGLFFRLICLTNTTVTYQHDINKRVSFQLYKILQCLLP